MLDDADLPPELDDKKPAAAGAAAAAAAKGQKNKKLAVPNFERFRLLLALGILGLILLIGGLIFALTALPKATIAIKTDATTVEARADLNLSTTAKTLDPAEGVIPAKKAEQQKTYSQQVPTTGQKNNGNRASGSVVVSNCSRSDDPVTLPAGTGLSSGGNTYISQQTVTIPQSKFTGGGRCASDTGKATVEVIAQSPGSSFNKPAGATYSVAYGSGLSGQGNTISGGTDNIVQTVNQNDINGARAKINANSDEAKKALQEQLEEDGYYAIQATYTAGTPNTTTSANVGDVANNVTVTETVTYTMFGVMEEDLKTVVEDAIRNQIDNDQQSILDNGLGKAVFNVNSQNVAGATVTVSVNATAGPELDVNEIRQMAAGKKPGDVKEELQGNPDVTGVDVKLSPFWVSSVPKKTGKIKVEIAKPEVKTNNSQDGGER